MLFSLIMLRNYHFITPKKLELDFLLHLKVINYFCSCHFSVEALYDHYPSSVKYSPWGTSNFLHALAMEQCCVACGCFWICSLNIPICRVFLIITSNSMEYVVIITRFGVTNYCCFIIFTNRLANITNSQKYLNRVFFVIEISSFHFNMHLGTLSKH